MLKEKYGRRLRWEFYYDFMQMMHVKDLAYIGASDRPNELLQCLFLASIRVDWCRWISHFEQENCEQMKGLKKHFFSLFFIKLLHIALLWMSSTMKAKLLIIFCNDQTSFLILYSSVMNQLTVKPLFFHPSSLVINAF